MLSAIVLAAGRSSRMGGPNKLLLPFRGKTILETVLDGLQAAGVGEIILVSGHHREAILGQIAGFPLREVYNPDYASGMTSSIQTGVQVAQGQGFMICLSDMPLIEATEYALLQGVFLAQLATDPQVICQARFEGAPGNPVVFSAAYRDAILEHGEPEGCKAIVQANARHRVWVDMPAPHVLRDVDYPENYRQLLDESFGEAPSDQV